MSDNRGDQQVRRFHRVNLRFSIALAVVVAVAGLGVYFASEGSQRRMSREALATATKLREAGNSDLAVRHLSQYLTIRPNDPTALDLRSKILAETAETGDQIFQAARAHDPLLRVAPNAPSSQDARRRLVALDVRYSDLVRNEPISNQFMNELYARSVRYRAAAVVARDLIARGGRQPGDYLLLAMALDGMGVPGDRESIVGAIEQYQNVLKMTPEDLTAGERLSKIYLERMNDPARAEQVLDELIKAAPRSVDARLVRHRLFVKLRRLDKAAVELEEASKLDPTERELADLMISASEFALRRGNVKEARNNLGRVPERYKTDRRATMMLGLIEFEEEQPDDAIESWRKGLVVSGGNDADMSWWLAYALLQMNRVNEALPLMKQYQRFSPGNDSMIRFLIAMIYERSGRPSQAMSILDSIRQRIDRRYEGLIELAIGRCAEGLWDELKAQEAYSKALKIDPASVVARLALAKLKLRKHPDEATDEIERGLRLDPENSALRVALAGAKLRAESSKPLARRLWDDFDRDWRAAVEKSPQNSALAMMWADRLSLSGHEEEAVKYLEETAARAPGSAAAAMALASGFNRLGRPDKALIALDRATAPEASGDQAGLRIARAVTLSSLYRGREAREALTKDVTRLPPGEQIQVWMTAGQFDMAQGDNEAASAAYLQWRALSPDDPRPLLVLLELSLREGNEPAIRQIVSTILSQTLGVLGRSSGLTGEALQQAAEADLTYMIARTKELLWQADHPNVLEILGPQADRAKVDKTEDAKLEAIKNKKIAEAARLVDAITAEASELPAGQMLRAIVLEQQGHIDDAIATYMKVWERGNEAALPKIVSLLGKRRRFDMITKIRDSNASGKTQVDLFSAQIFLRVGDRTQAARIAEQLALDLNGSAEALGWKARMLDHLGRIDDAEGVLRALAERQPSVTEPWLALIKFLHDNKRKQALAETVVRAKDAIKSGRPELLDARIAAASEDKDAAIRAFEAAATKYPDDLSIRLEAARFHEDNQDLIAAEKYLRQAAIIAPKDRRVSRQLAIVLSSRAAHNKDKGLWEVALKTLDPEGVPQATEPEDRLARGVVVYRAPVGSVIPDYIRKLSSSGVDVTSGIQMLEDLIRDLPLSQGTAIAARKFLADELPEKFGTITADRSDSERARRNAVAERAIQPVAASGTDPTAIALYAQVLIQSKKIEAAEWQLDRLAALSPGDPRVASLRARLILDRSRPVQSAEALEQAYNVGEDDPGSESFGREAFALLSQGDPRDPSTQRLVEGLARKNPACSWMPAQLLAQRGDADEAFELLKTSAKAGIRLDDLVQTGRVALTIVTNSPDPVSINKAEEILNLVLKTEPNADVLNIMMAMIRHVQGNYEEEVRLYRKALERRPEDYTVLNNIAWALSEGLHRYDEALIFAEKLVEIHGGTDPLVRDTRGVIYTRLGRNDRAMMARAVTDLEAVVKEKSAPLHLLHLARAYDLVGRKDEAKKCRESAGLKGLEPRDVDPAERDEILAMLKP